MSETAQKPAIRFKGFTDPWEQRKLGDITETYSGGTPTVGINEYYGGEIPFIRSSEINSNTTELFITQKGLENSSARIANIGDILYALYGATSGEVGRARLKGAVNQAILVIQPHNEYSPEFLMQWLRKSKQNIIETYLQGGQGNLSGTIVKHLVIDCPTAEEQEAIGLYFRTLDNLITLHQRKYEKLVDVKKALLEKMFPADGENVPQIRFRGFTDPWEQRKLGEAAPLRGGYAFKSEEYVDNGIPIIRISNILSDGTIGADFAHYNRQNDDEIYSLKDGAALLAMSGATTGKVSILNCKNTEKYYQNQRVGYFERKKKFAYEFVSTIVRSSFFAKQLTAVLVAGAQPNVSSKDIDSFEFLFPKDKEEQQKIGHYFRSLDNLITLYQRKLEKLKNIKKALLDKMFV